LSQVGAPLSVRVALHDSLDNPVALTANSSVALTVLSGDFAAVLYELEMSQGGFSWTPQAPGTYQLRVTTGAEDGGSPGARCPSSK
jgi:hypothetical protein